MPRKVKFVVVMVDYMSPFHGETFLYKTNCFYFNETQQKDGRIWRVNCDSYLEIQKWKTMHGETSVIQLINFTLLFLVTCWLIM